MNNIGIKNTSPLRILVFGAGAIGTYMGGSLAMNGHPVTFLERPEVAAQLKERGMRLLIHDQEKVLPNPGIASSLAEAFSQGPYDAAIFALKSNDTTLALKDIASYVEQMPPVLCLQNGVENEVALSGVLGPQKVIAGSVISSIGRRNAGDIVLEKERGMGIADTHPLSFRLVQAFNNAGIEARLYPRAADMKWSKMLTNLLGNATSAILDMSPAEIFSRSDLCRIELIQIRETLAIMAAQDIHVVDLPHTPVRLLSLSRFLPAELAQPILLKAAGNGRGGKMPSFHIDLHNGKKTSEVEYLNGAVVRFGEKFGVPTPVTSFLTDTLLAMVAGNIRIEEYSRQPEKLLARLNGRVH